MKAYSKIRKIVDKFHNDTIERGVFVYDEYRNIINEMNELYDNNKLKN
jgi:hypothetical protein